MKNEINSQQIGKSIGQKVKPRKRWIPRTMSGLRRNSSIVYGQLFSFSNLEPIEAYHMEQEKTAIKHRLFN